MTQRPLTIAAVLALTGAALVGCSAPGSGGECAPSGAASGAVAVSGEFGSLDLALATDTPVAVQAMQRSVLDGGDGERVTRGAAVQAVVTVFNGEDGSRVSSESARLTNAAERSNWVTRAIGCATVGDRIAAVVPAADVYGEGRVQAAGVAGLTEESALLIVLDLMQAVPEIPGEMERDDLLVRAAGEDVDPVSGLPAVERSETGEPTVTIADGESPPDSVVVQPVILGEGAEVQPGDRVYLHSKGVVWRTGTEFESTWGGTPRDFITTGMLPGLAQAVEGQRVGSQVLAVVPAAAGYGEITLDQMGYERDDVMVFVIDILGAAQPAQ